MADIGSIWLLLFVIGGLYLLIKGADHLVDGSSALALQMGVSPLLIGLTIVAFGTSAPELATCLRAVVIQAELPPGALPAASQFALGNVVGSNICNLAFVLGAAVMLVRISVDPSLLRRELPFMVALTIGFVILVQTAGLSRGSGMVLLGAFLLFCAWTSHETLKQRRAAKADREAMAEELSPLGVRVMSVLPDAVDTDLIQGTGLGARGAMQPGQVGEFVADLLSAPSDETFIFPGLAPLGARTATKERRA